ncbi:MAG: ABC transporter ATP-binding protein [Actinomycetota bacterium]|nr:ABC transporter ATP-binding protein [Actinomycetota bacterium]MDA3007424.1 ABC transporter ATP-binding protein [Actinomycetota bacterium]
MMSLLEVNNLVAGYGMVQVLNGISLSVEDGEVAVVLGANGAGKTTTLRALTGMIKTSGSVLFEGEEMVGKKTDQIVRRRIAHVPQGRGTVAQMDVDENLDLGAYIRTDKAGIAADKQKMFELFPRLAERRKQSAGSLSGGEQQMLAIARALMMSPRLLLLDEPSLGLAPLIIRSVFDTLRQINTEFGTTMLVVEQNANLALSIAKTAFVLETGDIVAGGSAEQIAADDTIRKAYLGI